jgi:hypothetical protein
VLAPVKGKPLFELKIGDKIMIRLDGSNPQARRYIEMYKLNVDSSVKPMPGEVVDIKADSKTSPIEILLKIDEHLYARCSEEERQVKLRLYDQRLDGTYRKVSTGDVRVQQDSQPEQKSSATMLMLGLVAGIAVLIILAIYLLV